MTHKTRCVIRVGKCNRLLRKRKSTLQKSIYNKGMDSIDELIPTMTILPTNLQLFNVPNWHHLTEITCG